MKYAIAAALLAGCAANEARIRWHHYDDNMRDVAADSDACKRIMRAWGSPKEKTELRGREFWTYVHDVNRRVRDKIVLEFDGCQLTHWSIDAGR